MNIFRALGDMSHLAAKLLLVVKLDVSRSAAGVSLKTQKLYLLVFLTRYLDLLFRFYSWYNSAMKVAYIVLTTTTIGMMRYRPSLRASYDVSLDHFRMWMHGIIPSFVLAVVVSHWNGNDVRNLYSFKTGDFWWIFSEVLEPLALVPQLLVFRGCTDAGRLAWIYVSLLVSYRALYLLNWVWRAHNEYHYVHHPLLYAAAAVHVGMYVVFMVDRKCRVSRHLPPDETGDMDMMEPNSAARTPLLEDHVGTDDYSGDGEPGSIEVLGGDGAAVAEAEARPSREQRQGGEVESIIEGVLMRERGQPSSPPGSGVGCASGDTTAGSGGGMTGAGGGVHLV